MPSHAPVFLFFHLFLSFSLPSHASSQPQTTTTTTPPNTIDWIAYTNGTLGPFPQRTFKSTSSITAPLIHITHRSPLCDSSSLIFLCAHGESIRDNRLLLLDGEGELVWWGEERGAVNTFKKVVSGGREYLAYWVGDDEFWGHGRGYYKMLDQSYELTHTITAHPPSDADYHDFSITPQQTLLLTSYNKISHDLSRPPYNRPAGTGHIWDCRFQELSLETNELLFGWRAMDHFSFGDMAVDSWTAWTGTEDDPWDWFHLNSVQKDERGNFVVAARYTNAITYVDGVTGDTLWQLGGKEEQNSFIDLAEGNATRFVDPHMALLSSNGTELTLFDNIDPWTLDKPVQQSRGLRIKLNHNTHIAKVTARFVHPDGVFARSEGSMHPLDNGNYMLSYGSSPVYAEFSPEGELLCSAQYAPSVPGGEGKGGVGAYRVYKQEWKGDPMWLPDVKVERDEGVMYVSWNGATEVRAWRVEGRQHGGSESWVFVNEVAKTGFETAIPLARGSGGDGGGGGAANAAFTSHRLTALSATSKPLRWWFVASDGTLRELVLDDTSTSSYSSLSFRTYPALSSSEGRSAGVWAVVVVIGGVLGLYGRRWWGRWRRRRGRGGEKVLLG